MSDASIAILVIAGVVMFVGVALFSHHRIEQTNSCEEACWPRVSRAIMGQCHCATEDGWDRIVPDGGED